ncbi:hypothetical protein [Streptomyces sp. NPDC003635]
MVLSTLLLTSCTSADDGDDTSASRPTPPASSPSRTAAEPSERDLTGRAQAAIASVHSGTLVESGVERVTDGVHTEPGLSKGRTYRLNLVCVGSGSAHLEFVPSKAGTETSVPCDEAVVQQRISGDKPVRIHVDGAEGSTGVIAWRIDAL